MAEVIRRVLLVRHGQSEGNVEPAIHQTMADHAVPLSEHGVNQAQAAGRAIGDFYRERYRDPLHAPAVRLWTSPYRRTRQTTASIVSEAGVWIRDQREHVLLCEQQFGLFDGVSDADLPLLFPAEHAYYRKHERFEGKFWARMPLGESRFDVAVRVHQAFGTFQRDAASDGIEDLIVVCHGVVVRAFVMMWCHYTPEWFEAEPNPPNGSIRVIEEGKDLGYVSYAQPNPELPSQP